MRAGVTEATFSRHLRQTQVIDWCSRTFGDAVATDPLERAARLIEEAIELVQACGLPADRVADIARHVYSKPVGEVAQEVGGVGVTLLALADVFGVSAELEERREVLRVLSKDPAHFRARQDAKAAAGVARVSEVQA